MDYGALMGKFDKRYDFELESLLPERCGALRLAYSLKETADMIGVSEGHLRNEEKRGKLKFFKSGRRTLILKNDLEEYLGITISDPSDKLEFTE